MRIKSFKAFRLLTETELAFFVAMEEKIALPPFGGTFGGNGGPGKSFLRSRVQPGLAPTRLFPLDHRTICTVFPVFAMFAMTTMAHSCTLTPVSQVTSIKAG